MSHEEATRQVLLKTLKKDGIREFRGKRIELIEFRELLRIVALNRVRTSSVSELNKSIVDSL